MALLLFEPIIPTKANDVAVVHAFYGKYRKELLKNGVQLYEFLPTPDKLDLNKNTAPEIPNS